MAKKKVKLGFIRRFLIRKGFQMLDSFLNVKIQNPFVLYFTKPLTEFAGDIVDVMTDDDENNDEQIKGILPGHMVSMVTAINSMLKQQLIDQVEKESFKHLALLLLDFNKELVSLFTDEDKDNKSQVTKLIKKFIPEITKVSLALVNNELIGDIPNENLKGLVAVTSGVIEDIVKIYSNDNPNNLDELIDMSENFAPLFMEQIEKLIIE